MKDLFLMTIWVIQKVFFSDVKKNNVALFGIEKYEETTNKFH
jgi:hypothetical protein